MPYNHQHKYFFLSECPHSPPGSLRGSAGGAKHVRGNGVCPGPGISGKGWRKHRPPRSLPVGGNLPSRLMAGTEPHVGPGSSSPTLASAGELNGGGRGGIPVKTSPRNCQTETWVKVTQWGVVPPQRLEDVAVEVWTRRGIGGAAGKRRNISVVLSSF